MAWRKSRFEKGVEKIEAERRGKIEAARGRVRTARETQSTMQEINGVNPDPNYFKLLHESATEVNRATRNQKRVERRANSAAEKAFGRLEAKETKKRGRGR
ncbi:hypothetical protein [Kribbella kalugense]|uniref:Uncharacterized protein n=1 Tax=Kribbella kalugense TaxID=2512221 RepID=A0A4R8A190_9ACTN|nr:hypothetical protein [Kribbella kalugense]TDW24277.1 hypothetical protein EV650_3150 [Kribbella kalugense]